MLISQEVLKIIVDDWIKTEKSLAKSCRGKFEEIPCNANESLGTGFGYVLNTYNATSRKSQEKSIWIHQVIGEKKWIIFTQTNGLDNKPVIEIWDDRINIRLDDNNLNGWEYLRIEALYDKLKPYVLYDIPDSDMEERNLQALALGHCIVDWLDKNRPIFKHPLEMASTLKDWHIEYETDDAHVSWSNIPNFRIDIMDDMLTYHHLYGRYILHDMPEKDNKPYWVISDKPIQEYHMTYFNQEKRDQMLIYIFRQHVEYILPENEQWFTGYTKNLVESIREAINGSTVFDWCIESQYVYHQKALQYKIAEETLTTKRGALVRTHKESETNKGKKRMNKLISQKELISIFQEWIEPFIPKNEDECGPLIVQIVRNKFFWNLNGYRITAQRCTDDNGTEYWRIYQNVCFDKPCLTIFPDHIRLHDETGYFESFSVDSIRDLSRMIESFEDKSDDGIKKARLSIVAVKVVDKAIDRICVRIGRISEFAKKQLEQIVSPKTLNFEARRIPNTSINQYEIELCVPLTDIKNSNNCTIEVLYDERHPNVIRISRQILYGEHRSLPWFDSVPQRHSAQIVSIPDELVNKAIQNIDQIKKEENTMFSTEEINVIKGFIDDIKKLNEHNAVEFKKEIERAIEQAKKATDTVCCDTPNATGGFTPGEVSKLIKSMRDSSRILVPTVKEILINKPATIIFWSDGSKTTSVCDDADKFDPEVGISVCIAKKYLGGTENLQLEARRALTRYERREAKKLKKNKKIDNNKRSQSSKKKK